MCEWMVGDYYLAPNNLIVYAFPDNLSESFKSSADYSIQLSWNCQVRGLMMDIGISWSRTLYINHIWNWATCLWNTSTFQRDSVDYDDNDDDIHGCWLETWQSQGSTDGTLCGWPGTGSLDPRFFTLIPKAQLWGKTINWALEMTHELSFWDITTISVFEFSSAPRPRDLYERVIIKSNRMTIEVFVILSLCVKVAIWKELRKGICYNIWLITIKQCESFELRQLNKYAVNSRHAIRMINGFSK